MASTALTRRITEALAAAEAEQRRADRVWAEITARVAAGDREATEWWRRLDEDDVEVAAFRRQEATERRTALAGLAAMVARGASDREIVRAGNGLVR